jgi:hypothetical protein
MKGKRKRLRRRPPWKKLYSMYARLVEKIARVAEIPYQRSPRNFFVLLLRCRVASEKEGQETAWQNPRL